MGVLLIIFSISLKPFLSFSALIYIKIPTFFFVSCRKEEHIYIERKRERQTLLEELQSKASDDKHRFLFCGIESFFNSDLHYSFSFFLFFFCVLSFVFSVCLSSFSFPFSPFLSLCLHQSLFFVFLFFTMGVRGKEMKNGG